MAEKESMPWAFYFNLRPIRTHRWPSFDEKGAFVRMSPPARVDVHEDSIFGKGKLLLTYLKAALGQPPRLKAAGLGSRKRASLAARGALSTDSVGGTEKDLRDHRCCLKIQRTWLIRSFSDGNGEEARLPSDPQTWGSSCPGGFSKATDPTRDRGSPLPYCSKPPST